MKQFQFDFHTIRQTKDELDKISDWSNFNPCSGMIFQIYSTTLNKDKVEMVCDVISQNIPNAIYLGCSTSGQITDGYLSRAEITVICTLLESPTTKYKLLHYDLSEAPLDEQILKDEIKKNPWVKAIEMQITSRGYNTKKLFEGLSEIDEKIEIFGGGAFNAKMDGNEAFVLSSQKGITDNGAVIVLLGGEDFHIKTSYITGWKPLGMEFTVTKSGNGNLYELDNKPAYQVYKRYLNITNDEHFLVNSLTFPFYYQSNSIEVLRAPTACNEDGSLVMTSEIDENVRTKLSYGDPKTILKCVREAGKEYDSFHPEIIKLFSCATRCIFWGEDDVSSETAPFQSLAQTSGFYTSGEYLRTKGILNQHNMTLVVAAMKEGQNNSINSFDMEQESFSGNMSMIHRLATFIDAATNELLQANEKLIELARTDLLSGLLNRGTIQKIIHNVVENKDCQATLIMLDIDNFKQVNDNFGHQEGDTVIRSLSKVLKDVLKNKKGEAGRWGGEEFMVLLPETSIEEGFNLAQDIRRKFNEIPFDQAGNCSVSVGVTEVLKGETAEAACIRVDKALYQAKETGKNKVIAL